jgi:hypothetical protein
METKELSTLVDAYHEARELRLTADKTAERAKDIENSLKESIIAELTSSKAKSAGGSICTVNLQEKMKPTAKDWKLIYEYIKENDAFDLLQRRLTETAVAVRWDDKIQIPGIEAFPVYTLTIANRS